MTPDDLSSAERMAVEMSITMVTLGIQIVAEQEGLTFTDEHRKRIREWTWYNALTEVTGEETVADLERETDEFCAELLRSMGADEAKIQAVQHSIDVSETQTIMERLGIPDE